MRIHPLNFATGTNTVTLEFSEDARWLNECICGINEWCEQHGEWLHGEWIDGDAEGPDVQPVMKRR